MKSVQAIRETLTSLNGSDLRIWVRERYGPAVSYTEATSANNFYITLDAGKKSRKIM